MERDDARLKSRGRDGEDKFVEYVVGRILKDG